MRTVLARVRLRGRDILQLLRFFGRKRSFWLALLIALLLVVALVLYLSQAATVSPYLYPLY